MPLNFIPNKWKISSFWLNIILSLYFTLVFNYAFYREILKLHPFAGMPEDYFLLTIPFVLFCALNIVFNILSLPLLHKVIIPAFLIISAAISYNSVFFNVYFDRDMLTNVLQTTVAESSRMLTFPYLAWVIGLGVIPAVLYVFTKVEYKKWWKEATLRFAAVAIFALGIVVVGSVYYQDYASFFRNNKALPHLIYPSNFVAATVSKIKHYYRDNMPFTPLGLDAQQDKPDAYRHVTILVVGETTRVQNWGLNGYARQTTPKLAARGEQIFNFPNVSSCGTATAVSVPCLFSTFTRSDYNGTAANRQDNLLDMLQRAGIQISWIENNSDCKGVCERVPTTNVIELNLPQYCKDGECLDNIMLPEVDKAFNTNPNKDLVLVLHTLGSHGPTYYERYTQAFRQFTPTCDTNEINRCSQEQLVNTYDNGILYLDNFLDQVIQKLEAHKNWESALLYVSDHGESLGENGIYLHGAPYAIAPTEQTRVPMIMWFSEAFRKNESFNFDCLRQNAQTQEYSHDNFFHTVISMTDMNMKLSAYDKNLDILGSCRKA